MAPRSGARRSRGAGPAPPPREWAPADPDAALPGIAQHQGRRVGEQRKLMAGTKPESAASNSATTHASVLSRLGSSAHAATVCRTSPSSRPLTCARTAGSSWDRTTKVTLVNKEPALPRAEPRLGYHGQDTCPAIAARQRIFPGMAGPGVPWALPRDSRARSEFL